MPILEVKGLRKSFGAVNVLRGIDFTLEAGEVLTVIGSSGGGKTTLLRCLNFLELPDGGEMLINGESTFYRDDKGNMKVAGGDRLRMGLVFQQFNLFPQYSVMENLTLAPRLAAKKRPDSNSLKSRYTAR